MNDKDTEKSFLDNAIGKIMGNAQEAWDKCMVCQRHLPPGSAMNKLYDDKLGSITVCLDCSLKAILMYVRKLYEGE